MFQFQAALSTKSKVLSIVFFLIILTVYLAPTSDSFALSADEERAIDQNIKNEQRIERERQNIIKERENLEIENIGKSRIEDDKLSLDKAFVDNGACKVIKEILVENNREISSRTIHRKFIKKHLGKCLTKTDLKEIQDNIGNFYLKNSYISARVYFGTKQINQAILKIFIEEGKIEEIELKDNSKLNDLLSYRRKTQNFFAFPFLKKRVLNLRDLEQGIDQMNRLSSNNATIKIEPGQEVGYSKILVNNEINHLTKITLSTDNSGNQSSGKYKNKIAINQDNLLGLNDNIYINSSISNNEDKNTKYSKSVYLSGSIPLGYYTVGGSYSHSQYLITTIGAVNNFRSSGNTETKSFYLDRVVHRGKKHKISLKAELEQSDSDNYIEDTFIDINSRELTNLDFYLNNTIYTKTGSIYLQPSYSKGLKILGALKDSNNLQKKDPKAQYEYFGFYGSINNNFNIPNTKIPFNHQLSFDSQCSYDSLHSNKQFSIGDRYTVRGFEESQVSGDNGYYIRNDLKINSFYLIPETLRNSKLFNYGSNNEISLNNLLPKIDLGIFYDYGYARSKIIDEDSDEGYMSGTGAKINYSGKYFDWDITYSKSLHSPRFLKNIDRIEKDNESIYFNLSLKLSLF